MSAPCFCAAAGAFYVSGTDFEKLAVYRLSERLADKIWEAVVVWNSLATDTLGKQMIRAADSVGANIAEGVGRGSYPDNRRFVRIARGSLNETKHYLRRAYKRHLLDQETVLALKSILDELAPRLNAYLKSIGHTRSKPKTADNDQQTTTNRQKKRRERPDDGSEQGI